MHDGQILRFDLYHRDVARFVDANDFRLELALVGQFDDDFGCIRHHVRIGENDTIGTHDEPRAQAVRRPLLARRHLPAELAEEFIEGIVWVHFRRVRGGGLFAFAGDADIHDRRAVLLNDAGEVRHCDPRAGLHVRRSSSGCAGGYRVVHGWSTLGHITAQPGG